MNIQIALRLAWFLLVYQDEPNGGFFPEFERRTNGGPLLDNGVLSGRHLCRLSGALFCFAEWVST
jgi:hypothetical protein